MSVRGIMVGVVALVAGALPATAQQRGTLEFGAFGSNSRYDSGLGMGSSWGAGGRVGLFLLPRLSIEFEGGGSKAGRTLGLSDVNIGVLSGRLTAVPIKAGRLSILLGAGVDHSDTYFMESYGVNGLLGAKFALSQNVAFRVDAIPSYMANGKFTNFRMHFGLSILRSPTTLTNTVTRTVAGPAAAPFTQRPDSVSAYETGRLRGLATNYRELRDSLTRNPRPIPAFVMRDTVVLEGINFEYDSASFTPDSREVLDRVAKTLVASEWMNTSWEIAGHTSSIGTHEYNMALSQRRAESVRAYLVMKGVADKRLFAKGYGEADPKYPNDSEGRNWRNRRVEMRRIQGSK